MRPRSTRSVAALLVPAALAATWIAGCASQLDVDFALPGDDAAVAPNNATLDAGTPDATTRPAPDAGPDAATSRDAGKDALADARVDAARDAGVVDAAPDAAVVAPDASFEPVGAACASPHAVESRLCGSCGTQKRLCWPAADAGSATWLDWGPCLGEKQDAGPPNTSITLPCEMCGTKVVRYDAQCNASAGFCTPGPGAQCERNSSQWSSGLSCSTGLGRYRQCKDDCTWQGFGLCTPYVNPNAIALQPLGADAGPSVATGTFTWTVAPKARRLIGYGDKACPITEPGFPESTDTGYVYVEIRNPLAQTATVDLWHENGDTEMAVYDGSAIPDETDNAARRACLAGTTAADECPASMAADCAGASRYSTAGIAGVRIAPGASITVWNGLRYSPFGLPGQVTLKVRTVAVE